MSPAASVVASSAEAVVVSYKELVDLVVVVVDAAAVAGVVGQEAGT